ncbi:hypothetical protein GUITHDRAFT_120026 [Guillardia theta CCMP2712]|uniref:Magnesium transporter MgtE intracellular domain-containing protein n=1 Tax=Guillardia theta (strain CCMP2712) TaxID=905079 RepID=L1IBZ7_GUITC|nr:hypothetical protein GUITHDRAFT_120026 [Guillardia theta CCMP2712]EKX33761.1 hypothetical protein GUITHDRAFT_120026 [Guillardia theta CCMP2712]|eukprot:XP_005820741.1 hypothetical protein GUITHDRAFT_120026 [Guillardia theta CCMP2712]
MRPLRLQFDNGKSPGPGANSLENQVSMMMRSKKAKKFKKMVADKMGDSLASSREVEPPTRGNESFSFETPRHKSEDQDDDDQSPTLTALKKLTKRMDFWQQLGAADAEASPPKNLRSHVKSKRVDTTLEHALEGSERLVQSFDMSAIKKEGSTMHTWNMLDDAAKIDFYIDCPESARSHLDQHISHQEISFLLSLSLSSNQSRKSKFFVRVLHPHVRADAISGLELPEMRKAVHSLSSQEKEETFLYMNAEQIAAILTEMTSSDTYKTFELVEKHKRAEVFTRLPLPCQRDILDMAPIKYRSQLISDLSVQDAIALLLLYPPKAAWTLLKQFSTRMQEDVVLELPEDLRSQVLLAMSEREVQHLVDHLPQSSQVALMTDLSSEAVCFLFDVLRPSTLGPLLSELNYEHHKEAVERLSAAKRISLLQHLPTALKVEVTKTFDKREFLSLIKVLDRSILAQALQEMDLYDQVEVCNQIPDPYRTELVLELDGDKRLALLSSLDTQEKVSILKSFDKKAFRNTFNQLQRAYDADVLSAMNPVELAELICGLSGIDQENVLRLLKPEQLKLVLMEMGIEDCLAVIPLISRQVRCQVLSMLPDGVRSLVFRQLIFKQQGNSLRSSQAGYDLDALAMLMSLGTEVAYTTLREMGDPLKLSVLSKVSTTERTALLEWMDPIERAEVLDNLTLEDSANSLRIMNTDRAVEGLVEIVPNKRAILLVALPEKERVAIIERMQADEASHVLSSLPLPDAVAILKHLSPATSVNCFLNMTTEECVVVLEAVPARQRAEIMCSMEIEDSVRILSDMSPRKVVETLQHVQDNDLSLMARDLPRSLLQEVIELASLRLRTRIVRLLPGSSRASILNGTEGSRFLAMLKCLTSEDMEGCFTELTPAAQLQVIQHVPPRDAKSLVGLLPAASRIPLLSQMNLEACSQILKSEQKETIEGLLGLLTAERRKEILHKLPESVQSAIAVPSSAPQPQRSPSELKTSPASPSRLMPAAHDLSAEGAVVVSLLFKHDEGWAGGRRNLRFWEVWVKETLCQAVDTSPKRVELVSLQESTASLVLRCLASRSSRQRSPLELAQEIVGWLREAKLEYGLEMLSGTIHAQQAMSSPMRMSSLHNRSLSSHLDPSRTANDLSALRHSSALGEREDEPLAYFAGFSPESYKILQASDMEEEEEEEEEHSVAKGDLSLLDKLFEPLSMDGRVGNEGWSMEDSRASGGHDIFENLQMLQSTIQRRNHDIRSFTRSVRSLQHDVEAERTRGRERDKSGDFIYA